MSGNRILLDTNIVIALLNNDTSVVKKLSRDFIIFIPAIVLGELYYGAESSKNKAANMKSIDTLTSAVTILPCNEDVAKNYGKLKSQLKKQGNPIPENDVWIAAIAICFDLTLITRDKHFNLVKDVKKENW